MSINKIFVLLVCLFGINLNSAYTQLISQYTFSQSTNVIYDTLSAPQYIANGASLDNQVYRVNLPFNFNFDNTIYNQIFVGVNGYISFGDTNPGNGFWMIQSQNTGFKLFSGFDCNLASKDASSYIAYQTKGIAPNRTFIIQWRNFGFSGATALTANFQILLSETTGELAVHYGAVTLTGSSSVSVQVGLRDLSRSVFLNRSSGSSNWTSTSPGGSYSSNILYQSYSNPPNGLKFIYSPPAACVKPAAPTNLVLTPEVNRVQVVFTAPIPAAQKYLVVRTPGNTPLNTMPADFETYAVNSNIGNGVVVYNSTGTSFQNTSLLQNTTYTYTVFPYNESCYGGPAYNTTNPLTGTVETRGARAYRWALSSGSGDYQLATNWIPNRNYSETNDTLIFDNGGNVTVTNINAQTLSAMVIQNNTRVTVSANNAATLTFSRFFNLAYGSTLSFQSGPMLKFAFQNSTQLQNATFNGTLNLAGSSYFDVNYITAVVNGRVNVSSANAEFSSSCSTSTCVNRLTFGPFAVYNHQRNGGVIPSANYDTTATINISNVTSVAPVLNAVQAQNARLGNLVINCPDATVSPVNGFSGKSFSNVQVVNAGTGTLNLPNSKIFGDLTIDKGKLELGSSTIHGDFRLNNGQVHFGTGHVYGDAILDTGKVSAAVGLNVYRDFITTQNDTFQGCLKVMGNLHQQINIGGPFLQFGTGDVLVLDNPAGATLTGELPNNGGTVIIKRGKWSGPGKVNHSGMAKLIYDGSGPFYTSTVEWPVTSRPFLVEFKATGPAPYNRVYLQAHHTASNASLVNGIIVLGDYNLKATFDMNFASQLNASSFVATNGLGTLTMPFANGTLGRTFPVGTIDGREESTPVAMSIKNNNTLRDISIRVTAGQHPEDSSATDYIARHWHIYDSEADAPMDYSFVLGYRPADKHGSGNIKIQGLKNTAWTTYNSIDDGNTISLTYSQSNTVNKLDSTQFAAFAPGTPGPAAVYTWTGNVSQDYQVANNWQPARNNVSNTDILQFNAGGAVSVTNVPSEVVAQIAFTNNTTVTFAPAYQNVYWYLEADNDTNTYEMLIEAGSAWILNGDYFRVGFTNNHSKAKIEGLLELRQRSYMDFTRSVTIVSPSGILSAGSAQIQTYANFKSSDTTLIIYGTYEHRYATLKGEIPLAAWKDGSNVVIKGYANPQSGDMSPANIQQSFYNFTYDCQAQTTIVRWNGFLPDSVRNVFRVLSTGSGQWHWAGQSVAKNYIVNINKYIQTGGNVNLTSNVGSSQSPVINITDSFAHLGGTVSASYEATLDFIGTNGRQDVICHNTSPGGRVLYKISNPAGINLIGSGNLLPNSDFTINNYGGIIITHTAVPPINTNLKIAYLDNARLTYTGNAAVAGNVEFPAISAPPVLVIDLAHPDSVLLMPFNRTVRTEIRLQNGHLDIGAYDLTLGQGTTSNLSGNLVNTSGNILMTSGSFTRWIPVNTAITGINNSRATFPVAAGKDKRWASLFFSASSSVQTGGTITVRHNALANHTGGFNINDGSFNIGKRSNSSWLFEAANGLVITGTVSVALKAENIFQNYVPNTQLRVMWPNTIIGTHLASGNANYDIARAGMPFSNLVDSAFYIGASDNNLPNDFISVQSGSWNDAATWNRNAIPGIGDNVYIDPSDTVVIQAAPASAKFITINPGGVLSVSGNSTTVDSNVINNGAFLMSGGTFTNGPSGGGGRDFSNGGLFKITNGTLNVNGSFAANGAGFIQHGGEIIVDGNSGTAATSVPPARSIAEVQATFVDAVAGTLTIVDPHHNNNPSAISFRGGGFAPGHTLALGNSVSSGSTGNTDGFIVNTSVNQPLGDVVINGSVSGINRHVTFNSGAFISGNLSLLNERAELRMRSSLSLYQKGNIYIDSGATMVANGNLYLSDVRNSFPAPNPNAQIISGKGQIKNLVTNPTAHFKDILINNTSVGGVTFDIGDFAFSGTLTITNGVVHTSGRTLTEISNASFSHTQSAGWVNGIYRKHIPNSTNIIMRYFPVGNATHPTWVTLQPYNTGSVLTPGFLTIQSVDQDHPNINTSPIEATKSVNRYFVIDTLGGNGVVLRDNAYALTMNWNTGDLDTNTSPLLFNVAKYNGATWDYYPRYSTAVTSITINVPGNDIYGAYQSGEIGGAPSILLQPQSVQVCENNSTAFELNASGYTAFRWERKEGNIFVPVSNNATYAGAASGRLRISRPSFAMDNQQYRCIVFNLSDSVISDTVTLHVMTNLPLSVTLSSNKGNQVCAGETVVFTAQVTNGGNNPVFQWKRNGSAVGNNAAQYTASQLSNNDEISCVVTGSLSCADPLLAVSDTITMNVSSVNLVASITASANAVCAGDIITFEANVTNGGPQPSFQWKLNGNNVGNNSNIYSANNLNNDDKVYCIVSGSGCTQSSSKHTDTISVAVHPNLTPLISITASNSTICSGETVVFNANATHPGSAPLYIWKRNGSIVGSNSASYATGTVDSGDIITCELVSSIPCPLVDTAVSNSITMHVNALLTPLVAITASDTDICSGSAVTFTATIENGGTNPVYQWRVNGLLVGTNAASFTSSALNDNDTVRCTLISNAGCLAVDTVNSVGIIMNVNPNLVPAIVIVPSNDTICDGDNVTFTATVTNGGTSPVYQWKLNGQNAGGNASTYTVALDSADRVSCELYSSETCITATMVSSDTLEVLVLPVVTPAVTVTSSHGNVFCEGSNVTFTAAVTHGGTVPSFRWKKNNVNVGGNSDTYTDNALADGDTIVCEITSNERCITATTVVSDELIVRTTPMATPAVTISANPGVRITEGTQVQFTATGVHGGTAPVYGWFKNNQSVGTNAAQYSTTDLKDGDVIYVVMNSNAECVTSAAAESNKLIIEIVPFSTGDVSGNALDNLKFYPNPSQDFVIIEGEVAPGSQNEVEISVLTMSSQIVKKETLHVNNSRLEYTLLFPGDLPNGTYIVVVRQGKNIIQRKVTLMR